MTYWLRRGGDMLGHDTRQVQMEPQLGRQDDRETRSETHGEMHGESHWVASCNSETVGFFNIELSIISDGETYQ